MKFKVGDKVRVISTKHSFGGDSHDDFYNREGVIHKSGEWCFVINNDKLSSYGWHEDDLELSACKSVLPEELFKL